MQLKIGKKERKTHSGKEIGVGSSLYGDIFHQDEPSAVTHIEQREQMEKYLNKIISSFSST